MAKFAERSWSPDGRVVARGEWIGRMCTRTTCRKYGQSTWNGCGSHVKKALAGVSKNERCTGPNHATTAPTSGDFSSRLRGR